MKFFCILWLCMFLSEIKTSTTDDISAYGYMEQNITISCSFTWAHSNRKYFCRDPCKDRDILVKSEHSLIRRFKLKDFKNGTFIVTITELQESDSGVYWCAVERFGVDSYHKVTVNVSKGTGFKIQLTTPKCYVSTPSPTEDSRTSLASTELSKTSVTAEAFFDKGKKAVPLYSILYAVGGLIVMVIIFAVGLVTVCQYKKQVKTSASCVPETSIGCKSEETNSVYDNDLDDRPSITTKKFNKTNDFKSQSDPVYENVQFKTQKAHARFDNL
ncbi:CMRF35-like molecule 1 isoform X2 [Myxocyprinus asiaticus]|uniref:CMRF35-like molecule 1 isoform X2 n=1 Tax=Myxocyprinus asiaticus TaxID=70543 RepID=UPI002221C132|nr:CMRF35-like molecule 1 isoform X2 [Myxocyprinus asiaticus]